MQQPLWKVKYSEDVLRDSAGFLVSRLSGPGLGTAFYNGELATDEDLWDSPFKGLYQ